MKFEDIVDETRGGGFDSMGVMQSLRQLPWVAEVGGRQSMNDGFAVMVVSKGGDVYEFMVRDGDFAKHPDVQAEIASRNTNPEQQ